VILINLDLPLLAFCMCRRCISVYREFKLSLKSSFRLDRISFKDQMYVHVHIDCSSFGHCAASTFWPSKKSAMDIDRHTYSRTYLSSDCSTIATAVLVDSGQRISEVRRQLLPTEFSLPLLSRSSSSQTICLLVGIIGEFLGSRDCGRLRLAASIVTQTQADF